MNMFRELKWLKVDSLAGRITRETIGNFFIQAGFAAISLVSALILARFLGPREYGIYSNALAWANILMIVAPFGFGNLLVREVATYRVRQQWASWRGLLRFSDAFVLGISVILMIFLAGSVFFLYWQTSNKDFPNSLLLVIPLIPLWSFAVLRQATLRGLEKPLQAMFPDLLLRPALTLMGFLSFYFIGFARLNASTALGVNLGASVLALILAVFWVKKFLPADVALVTPIYEIKKWLGSALPLFLFSVGQVLIVQSATVLLGLLNTPESVGIYSLISRLANLMVFLPLAVGLVTGPLIARFRATGEHDLLRKMLTKLARVVFIFNLLVFLFFISFGSTLLALFGQEYSLGYRALLILLIGYLVDSALGNSINLLVMSGFERIVAVVSGLNALINVFLGLLMFSTYGFEAAAIISSATMVASRLILSFYVQNKLEIAIHILG